MPVVTLPIGLEGPIATVLLHLSRPRIQLPQSAGQPVSSPIVGRGLIDTGASGTAIDTSIVQSLGSVPTGVTNIFTPSTGAVPHMCNQYDISLGIVLLPQVHASWNIPVVEARLLNQGQSGQRIHALIGRDVLAAGMLVYNGRAGSFSLAF